MITFIFLYENKNFNSDEAVAIQLTECFNVDFNPNLYTEESPEKLKT